MARAKAEYKDKLEDQFASNNTHAVWQGLQTNTQYKAKSATISSDPTLPDRLNEFYARFDRQNSAAAEPLHLPPPSSLTPVPTAVPPPTGQTCLWSSAVASSSSPHPPPTGLASGHQLLLQAPTPTPPPTGPASGHQLSLQVPTPTPPRHHPSHRTGLWSPAVAPSPPPPPQPDRSMVMSCRQADLQGDHPQRRCPSGVCAFTFAVLAVHKWQRVIRALCSLIKFSDDTTLEGLIHNSDESAYWGEVERLAGWCSENDLELNVSKTKEMVFDFRKKKTPLVPLNIASEVVEEVKSFKFLGTTISSDLKWDENFSFAIKKAHQRYFFVRQLKKFSQSFHTDSVLPRCNWEHSDIFHHCLVQQRVSERQKSTRKDSSNSL